jgi:hypothetical protein
MQAEVTHGIRTRGYGFWGGEMKTVKITIEVEVPLGCTHVAIDSNGDIYAYFEKPNLYVPTPTCSSGVACWYSSKDKKLLPINWRETLTEVK